MPVLPPTAASTMPSRLVGTMATRTPRSQVAATKPARSVVAPPPRPTTPSERVKPALPRIDQHRSATATLFAASASGTSMRTGSRPASVSRCDSRSAGLIMVGGCSSATRCTSGPSKAGTSASSPRPTSTWYGRSAATVIRAGSAMGGMGIHDHLDDLGRDLVVGVDHLGCYLGVQCRSLVEQLQQLPADIAQQQRPSSVEPDPLHGLAQTDPQPHHPLSTQCRPGGGGQHRTAAERQDAG